MKAMTTTAAIAAGFATVGLLVGCAPATTDNKNATDKNATPAAQEVTITQATPGTVIVTVPDSLARAGWYPQLASESCGSVPLGQNSSWSTSGVSITAFTGTKAAAIRLHHDTKESGTCEALPIPAEGVSRYKIARKG